jgi:TrmH family RNA methyltransferase
VLEEGWGAGDDPRAAAVREGIRRRGDAVLEVGRSLMRKLSDTETPQGVLCVVEAPRWTAEEVLRGPGPTVVLDRLQDPGNLGTIVRSAEAAGASGVLLTPGCVDPGNPKALRASAGSLLRLPTAAASDVVSAIRGSGRSLIATTGRGGKPYDAVDLVSPLALIIGQEGSGVSDALSAAADLRVTIPLGGRVESLNAAAAATVILFEAARQRRPGF